MKKLLLSTMALAGLFSAATAQTTLFSENFESGGAGGFSLNASDLGGATNSSQNDWVVNNSYTGGSGTFVCLGFPLSFTVNNTQNQPGAITNSPNSYYAHIAADAAVSSGITCGSYVPADGTCAFAESHFMMMTSPISTVGYTNVTMNFWWICGGSPTSYGELYYSLDNGLTWTSQQTGMYNQTTWISSTQTNPAWDNQSSIYFGFRFVNNVSSTGSDPGLGVDQILIQGTPGGGGSNSIATSTFAQSSWCQGTVINDVIDFNASGSYTAGNVFTAELSDASGSFASPTSIGTLSSTSSGNLSINITIPGSVPAGTGYRIRVVSSAPATTGTDNGSDLTINGLPNVTLGNFSDVCVYTPSFTLTGGSPAGGTYTGTGVSGGSFNPATAGIGTFTISYNYTDGNSCSSSANQTITVDGCAGLEENTILDLSVFPNPTSDNFVINGITSGDIIELMDMNGRVVRAYDAMTGIFSVQGIENGAYFLRVSRDARSTTEQLIINR